MHQSLATFAAADTASIPLHAVTSEGLQDWLDTHPGRVRAWLQAVDFKAGNGETLCVPDAAGGVSLAVFGLGSQKARLRTRFALGAARLKLPRGTYHLASGIESEALDGYDDSAGVFAYALREGLEGAAALASDEVEALTLGFYLSRRVPTLAAEKRFRQKPVIQNPSINTPFVLTEPRS